MATVSSSSSSSLSSLVPTKFRVLGFQRSTIRSEISSSISISKLRAKGSSSSSSSTHLVPRSFRFENVKSSSKIMKQKIPVLFANPPQGGDIVKGKAEATTEPQGPPILTILAGFTVFFFIAWIVGSIVMWLISLIFSTVAPK